MLNGESHKFEIKKSFSISHACLHIYCIYTYHYRGHLFSECVRHVDILNRDFNRRMNLNHIIDSI